MLSSDKLDKLIRQSEVLKLIPVSRSTWLRGVTSGKFPQPVRFGKIKFWDRNEILALRASGLVD